MASTIDQLRSRLEAAACGVAPPEPMPVCWLVERFLDHAVRYYPARLNGTSEADNFIDATQPMLLLYAAHPAAAFGPVQLQACRQYLIEHGLARSTINGRVRRMRQVFRWGASMGWLPASALTSLASVSGLRRGRSAAREPEPVQTVSAEAFEQTMRFVSLRIFVMSNVQLLTGARPGEICAMRGCEIQRSSVPWTYRPQAHKMAYAGQRRDIFIGPRAVALLQDHLRPGFIFPSKAGGPFRVTSYETAIRRAAEKAGVPHWSPNCLRHTAATLVRQRCGIETAQAMLGHARIETSQVYAARQTQLACDQALRFG